MSSFSFTFLLNIFLNIYNIFIFCFFQRCIRERLEVILYFYLILFVKKTLTVLRSTKTTPKIPNQWWKNLYFILALLIFLEIFNSMKYDLLEMSYTLMSDRISLGLTHRVMNTIIYYNHLFSFLVNLTSLKSIPIWHHINNCYSTQIINRTLKLLVKYSLCNLP